MSTSFSALVVMQIIHAKGDSDVERTQDGHRFCPSDRLSLNGFGAEDTNRQPKSDSAAGLRPGQEPKRNRLNRTWRGES